MSASLEAEDVEIHGIFHVSKKEGILAAVLAIFFLTVSFLFSYNWVLLVLTGFGFTLWLTFRASHWAIDGLESLGAFAGLSAYIIGVLSSLASNTPEAVVSGLTAWRGFMISNLELVDIAVLSVIMAAGFNILLLGFVVVLSTRRTGVIDVPIEVVEDDADLIRWTIIAMALLFAFGIIHYVTSIGTGTPPTTIWLPKFAGLLMMISYVLYALYAIKKPPTRPRIRVEPRHTKRNSIILGVIGFAGIFIAGFILTGIIELSLEHVPWISLGILDQQKIVIMAMVIGAAGAIPEHGIALIAAAKGKAGIAIGNTLGGTTQVLLLIVGGVSLFLWLPLDAAVLLQFATAAGSLWFLKRAMTDDHRVDIFEGAMILLMQIFVFIIVLSPL